MLPKLSQIMGEMYQDVALSIIATDRDKNVYLPIIYRIKHLSALDECTVVV